MSETVKVLDGGRIVTRVIHTDADLAAAWQRGYQQRHVDDTDAEVLAIRAHATRLLRRLPTPSDHVIAARRKDLT